MELSIENLDRIHEILKRADEKSAAVVSAFGFDDQIIQSPEKRSLLNLLLDKLGNYSIETAHIRTFLQSCEHLSLDVMTIKQKEILLSCQQLCQQIRSRTNKVLQWNIKLKEKFNKEGCLIPDQLENFTSSAKANDSNLSKEELLNMYDQTRSVLKEIHADLLFVDPDHMINAAGYALEIKKGNTLFIETEHEMNVVMDYGLFEYKKNGKNIVERYFDDNHTLYGPQKLAILKALKDCKFSLLEILDPVYECGVMVKDHLTDQVLLLIDRMLYESFSKSKNRYYLATHYVNMPLFALTTGAATPIIKNSELGKYMWNIFENIIKLYKDQILYNNRVEQQHKYVTDLYKIIIHEGAAKKVGSRILPMNYREMQKSPENMEFN